MRSASSSVAISWVALLAGCSAASVRPTPAQLESSELRAVAAEHADEALACYRQRVEGLGDDSDYDVTMRFSVRPDGFVDRVELSPWTRQPHRAEPLDRCIGEQLASWRFSKTAGETLAEAKFSFDMRGPGGTAESLLPPFAYVWTAAGVPRGSINRDAIRTIVRGHLPEVRACYEPQLRRQPALAGRVLAELTVAPDGSVYRAAIQGSSLQSPPVEACIVERARGWRFPAPNGGGIVIITYPFALMPAPPEPPPAGSVAPDGGVPPYAGPSSSP